MPRSGSVPRGRPRARALVPWRRSLYEGLALGFALVLGCREQPTPISTPRWTGELEAVVAACVPCHGEAGAAPRLDEFAALAACAEGEGWVRPGDLDSPLLVALARPDHAFVSTEARAALAAWVAGGGVYRSAIAHPPGFALADHPGSHAALLRAAGYAPMLDDRREDACAKCHDRPRELGGAVPCTSCHASTSACDTCHGAAGDPRPSNRRCGPDPSGAHAAHGPSRRPEIPSVRCESCHEVPKELAAPGHVADGSPRAELRFDPRENPRAIWDPNTRTCSGVDCHAGREKRWTTTSSAGRCDTCHGNPPEDHASERCASCHTGAFAGGRLRADKHLDGRQEVPTACDGCHGAPPRLGAHLAHTTASRFSGPVSCATCHLVPRERDAPGHFDTELPAEVLLSGPAATGGGIRSATFDARARTCLVACHGTNPSPRWESGAPPACGDCHGLPPTQTRNGASMHPATGPADCGACHRDLAGNPVTDPARNLTPAGLGVHLDGCVNLVEGCRP